MEDVAGSDLRVAHRLADIADAITGPAFRAGQALPHESQPDGSPVTPFDRRVEEAIAEELAQVRPDDAIVGEEIGTHGHAARRWVVDGIDGTIRFVTGDPRWSTMIALMEDGRPIVGVSTGPAQRRRWWASRDTSASIAALGPDGLGPARAMFVSTTDDWACATVTSIPARERLSEQEEATIRGVLRGGRYVTPSTHGAKMVAAGEVDACLQLSGQLWDYAALAVIVEQAGGLVSSLQPPHRLDHGGPMLFTNGRLTPRVVA